MILVAVVVDEVFELFQRQSYHRVRFQLLLEPSIERIHERCVFKTYLENLFVAECILCCVLRTRRINCRVILWYYSSPAFSFSSMNSLQSNSGLFRTNLKRGSVRFVNFALIEIISFEIADVWTSPLALLEHFAKHFVNLFSSETSNSRWSRANLAKIWMTSRWTAFFSKERCQPMFPYLRTSFSD